MAIAPLEMPPTKQPCPAGRAEPVTSTPDRRGGGLLARSHDSAAVRLRPFLLLRYTLVAATAYLIIVEDHFAFPSVSIGLVIAAALASNVLVSLLPARIIGSKYFGAGLVLGDTAWITAALLASGRFQADFVFLYFFVILLAAMGETLWLIVLGAVVVCIAYVYVLSATGGSWTIWSSPSIIRIPFLFTAAAFYGHMVDQTRHERRDASAAQDMARARGQFLATMSHEMRAPASGVIGWTELLLDTDLSTKQREYAEAGTRAARALVAIVNDILDLSKIDAGRLELELIPLDIRSVVADVAEMVAERAQRKGVELAYEIAPDVPAVLRGDPGRVRQVLTNLVGNAVKFTERGEVLIDVRRGEERADGICLRVEVVDTGIGLSAQQQARIFDRYAQAERSTSRRFGGTGLGLSISKQLVELMKGEVGVRSEAGQGSTFWCTMWFERGTDPIVAAAEPQPRVRRVLTTGGTSRTRAMLARQLEARGITAHTAEDAEATLAALRGGAGAGVPYEALIVDGEPQDTTVVELVRAVRRERLVAPVDVVVFASLHRVVEIEAILHALNVTLLAKPVRPERLWQWLATCIPYGAPGGAEAPQQKDLDRIALLKARIAGRA
jgi:signal transduction histidine kinase